MAAAAALCGAAASACLSAASDLSAATSAALRCCRADSCRLLLALAPDAGRLPEEAADTAGSEPLPRLAWAAESGCSNGGTGLPPGSSGAAAAAATGTAAEGGRDDERLGLAELIRGSAAPSKCSVAVEDDEDEDALLPSWGSEDADADAAARAAADAAVAAAVAAVRDAVDEDAASDDEDDEEAAGAREKTPGNLPIAVLGCAGARAAGDASGDIAAATAA